MKGYLITSNNCNPCDVLKEQFKELLESGEIIEKNLEKDEVEVLQLMEKYDAGIPSLLVLSDNGELIMSI